MSFSSLQLMTSTYINNKRITKYVDFTFPSSLGTVTINDNILLKSGSLNTWMDGSYLMMHTSACYPTYSMFNKSVGVTTPTTYYQTPLGVNFNKNVRYNSSNDGVIVGSNFNGSDCYNYSSGAYVGIPSISYFTSTSYTDLGTTLTASGEFIQLKFPFKFIIKDFNIIPYNNAYGPRFVRLVGSNDNINWTNIASSNLSGITFTTSSLTKIIDCSTNNVSYVHHRIIWEKVGTTGSTAI